MSVFPDDLMLYSSDIQSQNQDEYPGEDYDMLVDEWNDQLDADFQDF